MIRTLALVLLFALASAAAAEPVAIRSGQHETFSRLVLSIPEGGGWSLARSGEGYELALDGAAEGFDFSTVFDRIPRNRIAALDVADGGLRIDLACDCHADAFLWRPDRLVLDIVDGPAPPDSPFERVAEAPSPPPPPQRVVLPIVSPRSAEAGREPLVPGTFERDPTGDRRVAEAERAIVESLARAASQGVFAFPSQPLPLVAENLTEEGLESPAGRLPVLSPVTDPMDGVPTALGSQAGAPGLVLRTGIARNEAGEAQDAGAAGHCIADAQVAVQDWGDDRPFAQQVAERRRALSTEFDQVPDGTIEALARTYLFFGFGQEALQALESDSQRSRERQILAAMARVVDGQAPATPVLRDQLDCAGFVALWAALAEDSVEPLSEDGRAAAVMAFRVLPDALRGHLGATLARLFVEAGDAVTAEAVLQAARSTGTGLDIEADLTDAAVTEQLVGPEAAIGALGDLAEGNPRMTAQGLVRLIELQLSEGQTPDPALLDLAATMRFEAAGSDAALTLAIAEIGAHLATGDFAVALAIANDPDVPFVQDERDGIVSRVHVAMALELEEEAFLELAFGELPDALTAEAENEISRRLIVLGFPERALEMIAGPAVREAMAERRYLRAEGAAALGDIEGVTRALAGLSDPRAAEIRARVLSGTGDYRNALAQELLLSETETVTAEAWRAGAWSLLETGDDPLLQAASRAILTEPATLAATPTLAERRALLEQSQATRTLTQDLLNRFDLASEE